MLADALLQELCHPKVRIAKKRRNAHGGSHYLSIERPAAVANQEVRLVCLYQLTNIYNGLFRVHRQVRCYHFRSTSESLAQRHCWYALTAGKEPMKE
jgi:hypothetical protein